MAVPPVRASVLHMDGYTPGEQPAAGARIVKLNTNENPFPPSPRVMEAIRAVDPERLRRYPPPAADALREAAARLHGVSPDMIVAGNGSDDILAIALRTFLDAGDALAAPEPTYSLYPVLAAIGGVRYLPIPWAPDWRLPIDALVASGARAIFFANPNAPSGTFVPPGDVAALARRCPGVLLVDEAYADFADENALALLREHDNVVISRSLSKAYALAGLRVGYAIAPAPLAREMTKVKDSYNCDALSVAAAVAALEDQAYARSTWQHVRGERARLFTELSRRGFQVLPSQANFLLAGVPGGDARALHQRLKARGILVRFFDKPGLSDKLRVSVGTRAENDAFLAAL